MTRLDLEGLSKVFAGGRSAGQSGGYGSASGVVAVRDLTLHVEDGELLALVGPSGCGKTTTLRLIAGLEREDAGGVLIGGEGVTGRSPGSRNVAMVFPRGALYPHLTVRENLAWGARLRSEGGMWRERLGRRLTRGRRADAAQREAERCQRVRRVAELLGLSDLLDRLPSQLSDGQRQRVALGRAMVCRPAVYLMDEPLTGLDAPLRAELRRELKAWHQSTKATVVCVTHDQQEAILLGDRVAVMNAGQLQQVGTPREVYETPANRFVAGFIGSTPMNLIEGEWCEDAAGGRAFLAGAWRVPWPNGLQKGGREQCGRAVMGIRPEDIDVVRCSAEGDGDKGVPGEGRTAVRGVVRCTESAGDWCLVYVGPPKDPSKQEPAGQPSWRRLLGECLAVKCSRTQAPGSGGIDIGEEVSLRWKSERTHWFDTASGINLILPENS